MAPNGGTRLGGGTGEHRLGGGARHGTVVVGVSLQCVWLNWCKGDHIGLPRNTATDSSLSSLIMHCTTLLTCSDSASSEQRNEFQLLLVFIATGCDPMYFDILHNFPSAEHRKWLPHIL